jgi:hypothetical protein
MFGLNRNRFASSLTWGRRAVTREKKKQLFSRWSSDCKQFLLHESHRISSTVRRYNDQFGSQKYSAAHPISSSVPRTTVLLFRPTVQSPEGQCSSSDRSPEAQCCSSGRQFSSLKEGRSPTYESYYLQRMVRSIWSKHQRHVFVSTQMNREKLSLRRAAFEVSDCTEFLSQCFKWIYKILLMLPQQKILF